MFEVLLIGNAAKSVHFSKSNNFNRFRKEPTRNIFTVKSNALSKFLKTPPIPNAPKNNKKSKPKSEPVKMSLLSFGNEDNY